MKDWKSGQRLEGLPGGNWIEDWLQESGHVDM